MSKAGAQSTSATQVAPVGSARPASLLREVPGTLRRYRCYAVDDRPWAGATHPAAAYVYSEDRRGEHPTTHLAAFRGTLQVDGYAGFSNLVDARKDASIQLAFCWAHARRPFYEFYTSTQSPLAAEVLARIAKLYEIEGDIRGRPPDVRQSRSSVTKSAAGRGTASLATGPRAASARLVRPRESHALCVAALGRADPVPRGRTPGDGYQRRRAGHQASDHYEKELIIRGQ